MSLSEDEQFLAATALEFVSARSPVSRFRSVRDERAVGTAGRETYGEMAELGWTGILIPEEFGGAGLGYGELIVLMEAIGRNLVPEPILGSVAMGGVAITSGDNVQLKNHWLSDIAEGRAVVAFAHHESGTRYDTQAISAKAERAGDGFVLRGKKTTVLDVVGADAVVVPAVFEVAESRADDLGLFLVELSDDGVSACSQELMDGRNAGIVELDGLSVARSRLLNSDLAGRPILQHVMASATVALAAEMLGGMSAAFDLVLEHLRNREQFGVPIGSFQALQHRAARVYMDVELARSTVLGAARAIDSSHSESASYVSLAKAMCSDAYLHVATEGVQMFAGVGMTDEYDIGLYLKRARVAEFMFGDAAFHRDRWAAQYGY